MKNEYSLRTMVVDDFSTMRRIITSILREIGFKNIIEADNGMTAWELLQKNKIDFIVSDWNMPKMSGLELLKKVRSDSNFADIPFIMVTAETQKENIIEAVEARVSNYIIKPFTPATLQAKISKIISPD